MPFSSLSYVFGTAVAYALSLPLLHLLLTVFFGPALHDWPWYAAAGFLAGVTAGFMPREKVGWRSLLNMGIGTVASAVLSSFGGLWVAAFFAAVQLALWIVGRRRMLSQCDPTRPRRRRRRMRDWVGRIGGDR